MADITPVFFFSHLRAEPNEFILHYRDGQVIRKGAGLAYWFAPLSASLAMIPVEDLEATFMLNERSSDMQDITAQCAVRYRFADPEKSASRVNFTIAQKNARWVQEPLEKVTAFLAQRSQGPARAYLTRVPAIEAVRVGADQVRTAIVEALQADAEVKAMGLQVVNVQIARLAPSAELEKAMQTPTREALQQKADEAVFARRAQAVEKERAIKENELATQIELAKRQEEMIRQIGANQLREVEQQASAERAKSAAEADRLAIIAEGYARDVQTRAGGDAAARRLLAEAEIAGEKQRMEIYQGLRSSVLLALALRELGGKITEIQHLNITPDLIGQALTQLLRDSEASQ